MKTNYKKTVKTFKALSDETRLKVLDILGGSEPLCACRLLTALQDEGLNVGQSTLSHHMKLLCDAELVQYEKEGRFTHYTIAPDISSSLQNLILSLEDEQQSK